MLSRFWTLLHSILVRLKWVERLRDVAAILLMSVVVSHPCMSLAQTAAPKNPLPVPVTPQQIVENLQQKQKEAVAAQDKFKQQQESLDQNQFGKREADITNTNRDDENDQTLKPIESTKFFVNDFANLLAPEEKAALEQKLLNFNATRGSQILIWTIPSTAPETLDEYSLRLVDALKIGRDKVDDGVLILIAPKNSQALRRVRIEVGRGLEGTITDAWSSRVIRQIIAPSFREQQYYVGLDEATSHIMAKIEGESLPMPEQTGQTGQTEKSGGNWLFLLLLLFIIFMIFKNNRRRYSSLGNSPYGRSGPVVFPSNWGGGYGGGGHDWGGGGGGFSGGGGDFGGGGASGDW